MDELTLPPPQARPGDLFFDLDRTSPVPLYHQVAACIEAAIRDDRLRPGMRIENEIALGRRLGLARPTVRHAIEQLVDKGLLVRRRGIGTQVVQAPITRDTGVSSLYEDLAESGRNPTTLVTSQRRVDADAEAAAALGLMPDAPVWRIQRVRYADGRPLAILDNVLPEHLGPFDVDELERTSLYRLLGRQAVTVRVTDQRVSARAATVDEAATLEIAAGDPLLTVTRTAFDGGGRAVEFGRHTYAPELYALRYSLVSR